MDELVRWLEVSSNGQARPPRLQPLNRTSPRNRHKHQPGEPPRSEH